MTAAKIAISLRKETLARAKRAVRAGRAPNISAYVAAAIDERATREELEDLLAEMLRESGGPLTAAERHAADAVVLGRPAHERKSRRRSR